MEKPAALQWEKYDMINLTINGLAVSVEMDRRSRGGAVPGFPIPRLPSRGIRPLRGLLALRRGDRRRSWRQARLVMPYLPRRVSRFGPLPSGSCGRRMIIELLLARARSPGHPGPASAHGVPDAAIPAEYEDCIPAGLCVRCAPSR